MPIQRLDRIYYHFNNFKFFPAFALLLGRTSSVVLDYMLNTDRSSFDLIQGWWLGSPSSIPQMKRRPAELVKMKYATSYKSIQSKGTESPLFPGHAMCFTGLCSSAQVTSCCHKPVSRAFLSEFFETLKQQQKEICR